MAELNSSPQKTSGNVRRKRMSTRVDLTAMVDLAFLLITFFILTTTLAKPMALPLIMPDKTDIIDHAPWPGSRTMTICLGKDNKAMYYIGLPDQPIVGPQVAGYGKNGIRRAILENRAKIFKETGKDLLVIIKPDDHSVYDNLVAALDEMNITQQTRFAVADISEKDMQLLKQKNIY